MLYNNNSLAYVCNYILPGISMICNRNNLVELSTILNIAGGYPMA